MRIEQLVLYGPGSDDRVRFGAGLTVFSGLGKAQRADLIDTIFSALAGNLANASVIYLDSAGRKVYADRNGATYADTGEPAPVPQDLLGHDVDAVAALMSVGPDDLGLASDVPVGKLHDELRDRRTQREKLAAELSTLTERARLIDEWRAEQTDLTARIDRHADDLARWRWIAKRRRLDELRAERSMLDAPDQGRADDQILQAVDALRSAGESWTELAAQASEIRGDLGPLPAVSADDLTRVASTPATLPADFAHKMDAWRSAVDLRRTAEGELSQALAQPREPDDHLVLAFASLDQERLWKVHADLIRATEAYERATVATTSEPQDLEVEQAIEAAHLEVVRREREVERKVRPGILAAALMVATGLVAALTAPGGIGLGILAVLIVAAAATAKLFVIEPRRALTLAEAAETEALSSTSAGSWLGLHLRRLDAVTDASERKRFEQVSKARATAQLAWDELAGAVSPSDLTSRTDAVRAHALATDRKEVAKRIDETRVFAAAATSAEVAARRALTRGLEGYGFTPDIADDLDPNRLDDLLERRIAAGEVARRGLKLAAVEAREAEAARRLDDLLKHLGLTEGGLTERLERAIAAVNAARVRKDGPRDRATIDAESEQLARDLRDETRPSWAGTTEPVAEPVDLDLLTARRKELSELIGSAGRPDVASATRRLDLADARIGDLERRLDRLAGGPQSVQERLAETIGRPLPFDPSQPVPTVLDDALAPLPAEERREVLDHLLMEAVRAQVIFFTDDAVVTAWAKERADHASVLLYEVDDDDDLPTSKPSAPEYTAF